jgi:hypothetical protein
MTPSRPPSRSRSRPPLALLLAAAAVAGAAATAARPRAARAQACCVGTGLVTPARLRIYEDYAAGAQLRARSIMGSFGAGGAYSASPPGDSELDAEEDLFFAARVGPRFQAALQLPFVQTGRRATGVSGWGGGIGDVSVNARYDIVATGERPAWPGISVLAGLAVPTGRPVDQATDPLATSATGTGSFEGNLGLAVEKVFGRAFASASGWIAQRTPHTANGIAASYAPQLTAQIAGGYALASELTFGAFGLATRQGAGTVAGAVDPSSRSSLITGGAAVAAPLFGETWRAQGTVYADVPLAGWGQSHVTGAGLSLSLFRVWM